MPPRKPRQEDATVDLDDLLPAKEETTAETTAPAVEAVTDDPAPVLDSEPAADDFESLIDDVVPQETDAQRRIRELQEALNAPDEEEEPEPELSEEELLQQRQIEELEDQLAKKRARALSSAPLTFAESKGRGELVEFHVVKDGFTAFSNVWLRGQNLSVRRGSDEWKRTCDINGQNSFLDILDDVAAQYKLWGDRMIAPGRFIPRPDEVFEDEVAREDARRGTAIPTFR